MKIQLAWSGLFLCMIGIVAAFGCAGDTSGPAEEPDACTDCAEQDAGAVDTGENFDGGSTDAGSHPDGGQTDTGENTDAGGACDDGLLNGDETGVDCGGSCLLKCGLELACRVSDDCVFGICGNDTCVAPQEGPVPTGAGAVDVEEGEAVQITVVSDERVEVSVDIPGYALPAGTHLVISPLTPLPGEWLRLQVEPAGLILDQPATITVKFPASIQGFEDAVLGMANNDTRVLWETSRDAGRLELTAQTTVLGVPAVRDEVAGNPAFLLPSLPSPGNVLVALPIPFEHKIRIATELLTVLESTGRFSDAMELVTLIPEIMMKLGDPKYDTLVKDWIDRAWQTACRGLGNSTTNLQYSAPHCVAEVRHYGRPVVAWAAIMVNLEEEVPPSTCPAYANRAYEAAVDQKAGESVDYARDHDCGWRRCECSKTPEEQWTGVQQLSCPKILNGTLCAGLPPPMGLSVPLTADQIDGWAFAAESTVEAFEITAVTSALGLSAMASSLQGTLADPWLRLMREQLFGECQNLGTQVPVAKLIEQFPGNPQILADAQYCATSMHANLTNGAGTTMLAPNFGGREPGFYNNALSVETDFGGTLTLTGPTEALHCEDNSISPTEELVIRAGDWNHWVDVERIPMDGTTSFLNTPRSFSMTSLASAAGVSANPGASLGIEVWRDVSGCAAGYAPGEYRLFSIGATVPEPVEPVPDVSGTYVGTHTTEYFANCGGTASVSAPVSSRVTIDQTPGLYGSVVYDETYFPTSGDWYFVRFNAGTGTWGGVPPDQGVVFWGQQMSYGRRSDGQNIIEETSGVDSGLTVTLNVTGPTLDSLNTLTGWIDYRPPMCLSTAWRATLQMTKQ